MKVVRNTILLVIAMAAVTLLIGCAHVISKEVLKDVDKNVTFAQVAKAPDTYKGKTVLFGGAIIETINVADKSHIMILQQPLGRRDRPVAGDVSEGRFIVATQGFLDPAVYSPGRQVTVAGRVVGKEKRPMGEIEYTYPVIEKEGLYLWPIEEPAAASPQVRVGVGIGVGF
jgi:outer membrane lipoprotein